MRRHRPLSALAPIIAIAAVGLAACSTGVRSFEQFEEVVRHENDYSCRQLVEIANELEPDDRRRARGRLDQIGCDSEEATRRDR